MKSNTIDNLCKKIDPTSGCWLWKGTITKSGYGQLSYKGKLFRAHRFFYQLIKASIPNDKQLDHLCRQRRCVRPSHLEIVTAKENVLRGIGLTAQNTKKIHCPQGHVYDKRNNRQSRICSICHRQQNNKYARSH